MQHAKTTAAVAKPETCDANNAASEAKTPSSRWEVVPTCARRSSIPEIVRACSRIHIKLVGVSGGMVWGCMERMAATTAFNPVPRSTTHICYVIFFIHMG